MFKEGKVGCSQEDFDQIVKLFEMSVAEELHKTPGAQLDAGRMINEFRDFMQQSVETTGSENGKHSKELRRELESLQKNALRTKSQMKVRQTQYIEDVQLEADKMLEAQRPVPEEINIPTEEDTEISEECKAKIALLDDRIESLKQQVAKTKDECRETMEKSGEFQETVAAFLKE